MTQTLTQQPQTTSETHSTPVENERYRQAAHLLNQWRSENDRYDRELWPILEEELRRKAANGKIIELQVGCIGGRLGRTQLPKNCFRVTVAGTFQPMRKIDLVGIPFLQVVFDIRNHRIKCCQRDMMA